MSKVVTITINDEGWNGGEVLLKTVGNEPQKQVFFVDNPMIAWVKEVTKEED